MLKLIILSLKGFVVPREEKNEIDSADKSDDRPKHRRWMFLENVFHIVVMFEAVHRDRSRIACLHSIGSIRTRMKKLTDCCATKVRPKNVDNPCLEYR